MWLINFWSYTPSQDSCIFFSFYVLIVVLIIINMEKDLLIYMKLTTSVFLIHGCSKNNIEYYHQNL